MIEGWPGGSVAIDRNYRPDAGSGEGGSDEVYRWNREQIRELISFQERTESGCFFVSTCIVRAALDPCNPLPATVEVLGGCRDSFAEVLEDEALLVRHDRLGSALKILERQGMFVTSITLNRVGMMIAGSSLGGISVPISVTASNSPVCTEAFRTPYITWVHQAGGDNSHFEADDGSVETRLWREIYRGKGYKPIGVLEFM